MAVTTRFEWDPSKAASNLRKHHVDFQTATFVFTGPNAFFEQDRVEEGEVRWKVIGMVDGDLLLLVAHTTQEQEDVEVIRIISADPQIEKRGDNMKNQMVRFEMDLSNPPPLSAAQRAQLDALDAMPDSEIGYSDIPPLDE